VELASKDDKEWDEIIEISSRRRNVASGIGIFTMFLEIK